MLKKKVFLIVFTSLLFFLNGCMPVEQSAEYCYPYEIIEKRSDGNYRLTEYEFIVKDESNNFQRIRVNSYTYDQYEVGDIYYK